MPLLASTLSRPDGMPPPASDMPVEEDYLDDGTTKDEEMINLISESEICSLDSNAMFDKDPGEDGPKGHV